MCTACPLLCSEGQIQLWPKVLYQNAQGKEQSPHKGFMPAFWKDCILGG